MNARDQTPNASANDLPKDVKDELLRRVQNLPHETLIPNDKAFEELQRRARERNRPKPA
jgi:hypothetical protein